MKPYSKDLRERVFADCDKGLGTRAVATKYSVSESWIRRILQRRRGGELEPRVAKTGPRPSWEGYADRLREMIAKAPDATLAELREQLELKVALSTLWRAINVLGLTVKKKQRERPSKIVLM